MTAYSVVTVIKGNIRYWSSAEEAFTFINEHSNGELDGVLHQLLLGSRVCSDRPYDTLTYLKADAALVFGKILC